MLFFAVKIHTTKHEIMLHAVSLNLPKQPAITVAALAIDKVGPRPYHFRSGPTTRPGSQKSKISVVIVLLF